MRHFWELMSGQFGQAYADTLARDHVVGALGNRTVLEALEAGLAPKRVWLALCEDLGIPEAQRLGPDDLGAWGAGGAVPPV